MAEPRKSVESPSEKGKNGSTEKIGEIKAPQIPEIAPQIAAEKTEVKKVATLGTSEIKREVIKMEVNPDKETPSKIDQLDVNGNLENKEQKEGFDLLRTVTGTTLLAMIFEQGVKKEDLKPLENISKVSGAVLSKLNPAEKMALKKLQEIASKPGTVIYGALKESWNRLVDRCNEIYEAAKGAKENFNRPNPAPSGSKSEQPAGKPGESKEKPGFWENVKGFASDHPIITTGIALAGAYGVYKIFKMFSSSDEEKSEGKKEGFIDKILGDKWGTRLKWGLGVSAGIFVLGRLIGNEDIGKWLKDKLGINITGNRLSQFLIFMSHGEFLKAFKVLISGPEENFNIHRRMAEKISAEMGEKIEPETLNGVGNVKYDDFMSMVGEGKSAVTSILGKIPGLGLLVGNAENAEQEKILRQYFEKHKAEIDRFKNPTTTVDAVLVKLDGEEKIEADPEVKAVQADIEKLPQEKKEAAKEMLKDMDQKIPETYIKGILIEAKKINYDTKKIENLLSQRKQAWDEWHKAIQDQAETSVMAEKAKKILEINRDLGDELNKAEAEIMKRHGWTETELLAATHSQKLYRWWTKPEWKKQYAAYFTEKYIKKPIGMAKEAVQSFRGIENSELIGKEFKPNPGLGEVEEQLKKTNKELSTAKNRETSLKDKLIKGDQIAENKIKMNKAEQDLLTQDIEIHETQKSIVNNEKKLKDLKGNNGAAADIAKIEKEIADERLWLQTAINDRLHYQGEYLSTMWADNRLRLEKEFPGGEVSRNRGLSKAHLEQMDKLTDMLETHRQQIDTKIAEKTMEMENLKKEGKDISSLVRERNELQLTKVALDVGAVKDFDTIATGIKKNWDLYKAMKGDIPAKELEQIMETEKNQTQSLWRKITSSQAGYGKEASHGITTTLKRNLVIYAPFVGLGMAVDFMDKSKSFDLGKSFGQAAIDTLPFVSTASDLYSAVTGKEYISGRTLDIKDRAIRGGFFVGSLACDVADVAPIFMKGRAMYGAAKEARTVGKSMDLAESLRAARAEKMGIETTKTIEEMSKAGRWMHRMALGGALGLAGYEIILRPAANVELSPETMALLGNNVHDVDAAPPPKEQVMMQ